MLRWTVSAAVLCLTVPALAEDLEKDLCGGKSPCYVASVQPAGEDAEGRPMQVVQVVFGTRDQEWEYTSPGTECVTYQYWLVHRDGAAVAHRQLLLDLCNDGYGAASMGEDNVLVEPNRFSYSQSGGSAWRWSNGITVQLSPWQPLAQSTGGYWSLGPNASDIHWDWSNFRGTETWGAPLCDEDGAAGGVYGDAPMAEGDRPRALIPLVTTETPISADDWATVALGACAMNVDSAGFGGFVAFGQPAKAADASFRAVLIAPRTLVIEIQDDTWVDGAKSWLHDDHLELWLASDRAGYSSHCLEGDRVARQWGIRVSDGQVFPAAGKPTSHPTVLRRVQDRGSVRLVIELPEDPRDITVVYSDSDDGKTQERLIATSPVKMKDPYSLGSTFRVRPEVAVCAVQDGALVVRFTQVLEPDKPALGFP
jgi:hypothetical protein